MSEMVTLVLKRETAQTLLDKAPAHTPGEVFHGLQPHQLDLRYALERALATDTGDDWHPVLLSRERPGAMLGFAGAPEYIADRGGELQHYVPATQPDLLQAIEGEIELLDAEAEWARTQGAGDRDLICMVIDRTIARAFADVSDRLTAILNQYRAGGERS